MVISNRHTDCPPYKASVERRRRSVHRPSARRPSLDSDAHRPLSIDIMDEHLRPSAFHRDQFVGQERLTMSANPGQRGLKETDAYSPSGDLIPEEEDARGFLELQACIPHLATCKTASRLDILLEAINYIDTLHTTLMYKLRRGEMSAEDRKLLLNQYLNNMITDANKEN